MRSILQAVIASVPNSRAATVGDVARLLGKTTRITGTPEQIADRLQEWSNAGVDGINLMYSTTPGTFIDFIEYIAPELQRRGLMQREYSPGTLREKLFGAGQHLPVTRGPILQVLGSTLSRPTRWHEREGSDRMTPVNWQLLWQGNR